MTKFSSNQPVKSTLTAGQSLLKRALKIIMQRNETRMEQSFRETPF